MNGTAGLYYLDNRAVERQKLQHMLRRVARHPVDDSVVWTDGPVGLGGSVQHVEVPSMQEERGPVHPAARLAITFDGRLDNREELIGALGWKDHPAAGISDGLLILGAYEHWGVSCPRHLLGAFAFALWDGRRRRLLCGRDHLGLRPFYYFQSEARFAFGSNIKALLSLPQVLRGLNETKVADFLMQMNEDTEATFYKDIMRLPPAHYMTVTPKGVRLHRYWTLHKDRTISFSSDAAYAERYRQIFTRAVDARLRGREAIGTLLSGGLDSSAVTCVAKSLLEAAGKGPLDTFSLIFDGLPQSDERPYIDAVLEEGGLQPHFVRGDQVNPLENLDRMLRDLEEPFFTPNLYLNWHLLQAARAEGIDVILDGFLGDNVVAHGSHYLTELAATGRWLALAREMQTVSRLQGKPWKTARHLLRRFVVTPLVTEPVRRGWMGLTKPELPPYSYSQFINPAFARQVGWMKRARAFGEAAPRTPFGAQEAHFEELTSGMLPGALEIAQKAAAAFGITVRFPFADRRLMEYCLAVPATQKYQDGWTRVMVRRALADELPEKIRRRYGKATLHPALVHGLFEVGRERLEAIIFDRLDVAEDYLNVRAVRKAYRQFQQHQKPDEVVLPIWLAVILAEWMAHNWADTEAACFGVPRNKPVEDRKQER